jgi:hypothetical protein
MTNGAVGGKGGGTVGIARRVRLRGEAEGGEAERCCQE